MRDKKNIIEFLGRNATEVVGSMILVTTAKGKKILIECGGIQTNDQFEDYANNAKPFDFKAKEIDYVLLGDHHYDHVGMLPKLYSKGCTAPIYTAAPFSDIFKIMGADSANIISRTAEAIGRKKGKIPQLIYTQEDVNTTLGYVHECEYKQEIVLDEDIRVRFTPSGHIMGASQIEIWLGRGKDQKKIIYTADLGNILIPKPFAADFEPLDKADIVIAESTYAGRPYSVGQKDREKDLEKMATVIHRAVLENRGRVLIPTFALDRTPNILLAIYKISKRYQEFNVPVLVDSPMAIKLLKAYAKHAEGEDKALIDELLSWSNLKLVEEYPVSKYWREGKFPCIVLAANGFMTNGRSVEWAKSVLPDHKSHILFCGYASEGSLAGRIKNGKELRSIQIDKRSFKNRCGITELKSFTSHIQKDSMLEYYTDLNCTTLYLVHGNQDEKNAFAKELEKEYCKKLKSTRVVSTTLGTIARI